MTDGTSPVPDGRAVALWYTAPGVAVIQEEILPPPKSDDVTVRARFGAVSRGTESLVSGGRVPAGEVDRMRAPFQAGHFPFPVKYGYAVVGTVETGALAGQSVFVLHPHQTRFVVPAASVVPLPDGLPLPRAVLAANMETALNALWDAKAGPGNRIAVIGGGVVGSLVAGLAGALPGAEVTLVDSNPERAGIAAELGVRFARPEAVPPDCDIVFHASGNPTGLDTAIAAAGNEATVVEMSWYGDRVAEVSLGGAFHSRRLTLLSSQVGQVAPSQRSRWSYARRLAKALDLLTDDRYDCLLEAPRPFQTLPDWLPHVLAAPGALCPLIQYP